MIRMIAGRRVGGAAMLAIIALGGGCAATSARSVAAAGPVTSGLAAADVSAEGLARLDGLMEEAVARRDVPGAVLLVVHRGRTVYRRAFGLSQL
ncbi:MAG TPA: hypothetical protein ENO03_07795, partial [Candidatus Aminicenantes bacterium]|nr:hypothetical protein [Candidatus Aminicenantes bacterium]